MALAASLEHMSITTSNPRAQILADTLDAATGKFLDNAKSPSRKVNELDNRGSHFYLAMYWAEAMANQEKDAELKTKFAGLAQEMATNESVIIDELNAAQGSPQDVGGYYKPKDELGAKAMRPSATMNALIDRFN